MILHIVSVSPFNSNALEQCLKLIDDSDALLLIENGVYAGIATSPQARTLERAGFPVYILAADANARGIGESLMNTAQMIDHEQWVKLTIEYPRSLSWYQ